MLALLSALTLAAVCGSDARVRKEVRDMSTEEWNDYRQAVRRMMEDGSYEEVANKHVVMFSRAHGNSMFAPWHRLYSWEFETLVKEHSDNPDITLPYYAGWVDADRYGSTNIRASPVHSDAYFGGNSEGNCVEATNSSIFYKSNPVGENCVSRAYKTRTGISGTRSMQTMLRDATSYDQFVGLLEGGYHVELHTFIGGNMASRNSAHDPLFFTHHASIDYWYDLHQMEYDDYDTSIDPAFEDQADIFEHTYAQAHRNEHGCVVYEPYSGEDTQAPTPTESEDEPTSTESASATETEDVGDAPSDEDLDALGLSEDIKAVSKVWQDVKSAVNNGEDDSVISNIIDSEMPTRTAGASDLLITGLTVVLFSFQ